MVEKQFNSSIWSIQIDRNTEFKPLAAMLVKEGVVHHMTCPYSLEQNSVIGCHHHHIVKIGLPLLYTAHIYMDYLPYVMSKAAYLLNRLPTKILSGLSPYELLCGKVLDYSLIKVFECRCFPCLRG